MDSLADAKIIDGLRQGDADAWAALCDRFSARVWRYVARLVGSDSNAVADVFQETMLAAARSGRNLDEESRLWGWLARIAHNQSALFWRNRYRDHHGELQAAVVDNASAEPFELLGQTETNEAVRGVLAEMSADHVAVLTAKYIDDLSIAEIVEAIGGTTESVRSRLARARRDFRERCGRQLRDFVDGSVPPARVEDGLG